MALESPGTTMTWLIRGAMTSSLAAITFGAVAYFATLAERYETSTVGDILNHCYTSRPLDPEGCANLRLVLGGIIEKHVFLAVAASTLLSIALTGGAWLSQRRRVPT